MKQILIIIFLIISIQSFAQKHEIGIDLFTSSYEYIFADYANEWSTLRMNYKKYKPKFIKRYTVEFGKAPIYSIVFDTTFSNGNRGNYTNYSRKQWKLGLAYGLEKFISYRRVDFFYGIDAGLQFEQVLNGSNYSPNLGGGYADRPDDRETLDYVFGIVPFGGVRIRMFKGLFFNIELGAELNYISENRLYHTRDNWESLSNEYFYFPALDKLFINNIGLSYRF